jgi:predicted RNase H-like HicB family nuclease
LGSISVPFVSKEVEMNPVYTAIVKQDDDWWVGWIEEVPGVNCQERTHEELLSSLRITLQEALQFNRDDAISAAGSNYTEEKIAV